MLKISRLIRTGFVAGVRGGQALPVKGHAGRHEPAQEQAPAAQHGARDPLRLYKALGRIKRMNYRSKIMVVAFVGTHIPLIALAAWLALQSASDWRSFAATLGIALLATLVGTGITLFVLDRLLRPVLLTSQALRAYRQRRERLRLPSGFSDEVGTLMADTDDALDHLDQSLRSLQLAIDTKNRFVAAAAHDLRQPIVALSLYAQHLLEYPQMQAELAPKIARASASVSQMFDSLFDLANLDAGKVELKPAMLDLRELVGGVITQFEPLASAKGISLRVRAPRGCAIRTDPVRLHRMLANVLSNAIKYSPPDRSILVAARMRRCGAARLEVWDQGMGIPRKDLERVFEEFYRVDRPSNQSIDGVGLGLSIVSRLARMLRAEVSLSSREGQGTRFRFDVPALASTQSEAAIDAG